MHVFLFPEEVCDEEGGTHQAYGGRGKHHEEGCGKALDSIIGAIHASLKKEEPFRIGDLGTLRVLKRKARKGVNPQTGKRISIPAKKVPLFSAARALRKAVLQSK
jgi:DNA-binding protein HU-beta